MNTSLVMTVLGPDRPGIVDSLSKCVADAGGNWLESSMGHLAGHFAGIVHVSLPADQVEIFRAKLVELKADGLECSVQDTQADAASARATCYALEIIGHDRPGIVRAISDVIAQAGGNVESFVSYVESAPMTGDLMFHADLKVCFHADEDVEGLDEHIAKIGDELMLDINWRTNA